MPEKHPKRPRDMNQFAKFMVDLVTGEAREGSANKPTSSPQSLGGKARATKLDAKQRTRIARRAAAKRWAKDHAKSDS